MDGSFLNGLAGTDKAVYCVALQTNGQVLIGGHRHPIAGTVTMDQITVDCGPDADVAPGDDVVLIGRQGTEEITAQEWADRLDTIAYEVVCGVGPRVPRVYVGTDRP